MPVILTATSIADVFMRLPGLTDVETTSERLAPHCSQGIKHSRINDSSGAFRPAVVIRFPHLMEGWVSFYQWAGDMNTSNWNHFMWSLLDWEAAPGAPAIGIVKNINALAYTSHWPNGTGTSTASFTGVTTSLQRWDVYFRLHASTGEIKIYIDGSEAFSFTGNTLPTHSGFAGISALTFQREGGVDPSDRVWSGVIVSTTDTRGLHLVEQAPTGDGAFDEWDGGYEDVDGPGIDAGSFISTDATTQRQAFTFPALPGALSGYTPVAVGLRARGLDFAQPIDTFARIGTTVYTIGAALPQPRGGNPGVLYLDDNPATAAPWTIAAAEGAQLGVRRT